jgi:two-component system chemotaxis response regulator CheY
MTMKPTARSAVPLVLSVGQCGFDHMAISDYFADRFDAEVQDAHGLADAREMMRSTHYRLVLVNRVLNLDGSSGLDLIRAFKADPDIAAVPIMLVSDQPKAQQSAVSFGAHPGFGKADLYGSEAFERVRLALEG